MSNFQVNPTKIFVINGQNCPILPAYSVIGIGTNMVAIAAITGKIIRLMGAFLQSNGAASGSISFKNGSAGTTYFNLNTPPSTNGDYFPMPIVESGYLETSAGVGLYSDVATTAQLANLFYIAYTP